jgi:predicted small lipoprotein YifL
MKKDRRSDVAGRQPLLVRTFMKRFVAVFLLLALLAGCGYVLHPGPIEFADAPKWHSNKEFYVFENEPTNHFKLVCRIIAGSDVGDYPDFQKRIQIAKKFAKEYGGNGVILGRGNTASTNALNVIKVVYVEK